MKLPIGSRIYIAGHTGLIGSAIVRKYKLEGYANIITSPHSELNLLNTLDTDSFFKKEKPEYTILSAARVGGIRANIMYPTEFLSENIMIQNNIIMSSLKYEVKKLLYISCSCAYPTNAKNPIREQDLLTGVPEKTNEAFAIAKISGIKLCESIFKEYGNTFISCIPANTYGVGDHYDEENSHVIPALLKKFHEAKATAQPSVTLWGSGKPRREFIYVDDIANAIFFLMERYNKNQVINIGSGIDVSIKKLANIIKEVTNYDGKLVFDTTKPDGMLRRVLDSTKLIDLGFSCKIPLREGIEKSYQDYLDNNASLNQKGSN